MKFPSWITSVGLVFGLATGAHAFVFTQQDLGAKFTCTGGCVDTWLVECADRATHRITARVRNLLIGNGVDLFEVAAIGFTGSLTGQVDREVSPSTAGGAAAFSIPAFLTRTGNTTGSTKALVEVGHLVKDATNSAYLIEFACLDLNSDEVVKPPQVKLLQNQ